MGIKSCLASPCATRLHPNGRPNDLKDEFVFAKEHQDLSSMLCGRCPIKRVPCRGQFPGVHGDPKIVRRPLQCFGPLILMVKARRGARASPDALFASKSRQQDNMSCRGNLKLREMGYPTTKVPEDTSGKARSSSDRARPPAADHRRGVRSPIGPNRHRPLSLNSVGALL